MSAVRTPRALGRSVGLSAAGPPARRRRSGLLGTVGGLRAPGLHGVHPEEAARAAAAALLQGEVRGAGGRARRQPGALLQAAADSWAAEPRVGPASRGSSGREGRAVPAPTRRHAVPAGVSPPTLRAPQPACVGGCWRSACGWAVAVSRGPGRTWVALRPPSDPVGSRESALPPRVSFPGRFCDPHACG